MGIYHGCMRKNRHFKHENKEYDEAWRWASNDARSDRHLIQRRQTILKNQAEHNQRLLTFVSIMLGALGLILNSLGGAIETSQTQSIFNSITIAIVVMAFPVAIVAAYAGVQASNRDLSAAALQDYLEMQLKIDQSTRI